MWQVANGLDNAALDLELGVAIFLKVIFFTLFCIKYQICFIHYNGSHVQNDNNMTILEHFNIILGLDLRDFYVP